MNGEALMFANSWLWLIFVIAGLVFALLELLVGIDTGLDLVFIGSAFVIGGVVTWPFHSWVLTAVVSGVICILYVALGRRYIHRWTAVSKSRTNVDAIIGKTGIVQKNIARNSDGVVKVGYEQWKARAGEDIAEGDEIVVKDISGATLIVERKTGGNQ
jgi:membrane protein implicated in regulation of membrane protease activity